MSGSQLHKYCIITLPLLQIRSILTVLLKSMVKDQIVAAAKWLKSLLVKMGVFTQTNFYTNANGEILCF